MMMPNGRSPASCAKMFERLTNRVSSIIAPGLSTIAYDQPAPTQKPKRKRRLSGDVAPTALDRTIQPQQQQQQPPPLPQAQIQAQAQPQQYYFAPVNVDEPADHAVHWNPAVPVSQGEQPVYQGKKRGRPSKAEYEIKAREAAERGVPWPPPKKVKTPRPSIEGGSLLEEVVTHEPGAAGVGNVAGELATSASTKKKVQRKSKPAPSAPMEIPPRTSSAAAQRNFALDATASAAEQMQVDLPKGPETQTSDFAASESLGAEMQAQAAQMETKPNEVAVSDFSQEQLDTRPDTVQSSATVQQETDPASREERQERQDPSMTIH